MKFRFKSALAAFMAFTLVLSNFAGLGLTANAVSNELVPRIIFEDNCNSETVHSAWTGTATADGEKYTLTKGSLTLANNINMKDYTVEADVSIPDTTADQGIFANMGVATISVRYNSDGAGYEYGLAAHKNTTAGANVRMYGRKTDTTISEYYSIADALYDGDTTQAAPNNVYNLKVKVSGTQLIAYVDDVEVFNFYDESLTSGTVSLKALNCVATFDNIKVTVDKYLFIDDFSSATTTLERGWSQELPVQESELVVYNNRGYLTGFADTTRWTNYSVESYVYKEYNTGTSTSRGTITALAVGAKGTARSGIEFAIIDYNEKTDWSGNYDMQEVRLYDVGSKSVLKVITTDKKTDEETSQEAWDSRPYKAENGLTLKLQVINYGDKGKLVGYINGKEVISVDVEDPSILYGAPGVLTSGGHTAYYDHFKVNNEFDYIANGVVGSLALVDASGKEVTSLSLYRGFEIENSNYQLKVTGADGSVQYLPLAQEHIYYGPDGLQVGKNTVTLTYRGATASLPVTVSERASYVSDFCNTVNSLKVSSITSKTLATADAIEKTYNTLSPYEAQNLPQSVQTKYIEIIEAADRVRIPEMEGQDLLVFENFNTDLESSNWTAQSENKACRWFFRNGYAVNDQAPYSASAEGWLRYDKFYADIYSVEADICLNAAGVYSAVAFNYNDTTYYHARITNKNTYRVELLKYNGKHTVLGNVHFSKLGITGKNGTFYNLRVSVANGLIKVYVNDILAITYDDGEDGDYFLDGGIAFRNLYNAAFYDNVRVYGKAMDSSPDLDKVIIPTYYEDDFEDEVAGESPSHWVEDYNYQKAQTKNDWKVYNKNGNLVYGTTVTSVPTYTWLHGFEINPTYTAKFMYSGSGKVGFVTRLYDELSWLNVCYDSATSQWFLAATESTVEELTQVVNGSKQTLAANTWHTISIELSGEAVLVKVNGTEVLQCTAVECNSYGRMGVLANGAEMYVDDVCVVCPNGTTFVDGVLDYSIEDGTTRIGGYLEIEDLGNGHLVGTNGVRQYLSYDNGATWKNVTDTKQAYDIAAGGMGYTSLLNLGDGKWVQVRIDWDNAHVLVSNDNMKTWTVTTEKVGEDEYADEFGNKVRACVHVNSLTKTTVNGKTRILWPLTFRRLTETGSVFGHYTRFFYSDDGGYTWTESVNDTRDVLPGYAEDKSSTTAEGKIVACSDGTLRYYQTRNDYGNMIYFESKDGGQSWTDFGTIPYMQCPKGSFSVTEDTYNPGTYYLVWVHCNPIKLGSIQPRVRISLAKSTNGKDWEFLCDIERTSVYANVGSSFVRQFLDPNITVNEDYVYVTYGRSNISYGTTHNNQIPRYVRLEKDKLSVRPWDDATISDRNFNEKVEVLTLPKVKYALNETFTLEGGVILETALNGATMRRKMASYTMVSEVPDTSKAGVYTVTLATKNLHLVSFQVGVGTVYNLTWNIQGAGSVQNRLDMALNGSAHTFTLLPEMGSVVKSVKVNGVAMQVENNTFTIAKVQRDTTIDVVFEAVYGTTGDCAWTKEGTTLVIRGAGAMADYSAQNAAPWGTEITTLVIEEGVTALGAYAFYGQSNLTSVTLPDTVTTLGASAFAGCSKLTDVYFSGTIAQWKAITVASGNDAFKNATLHFTSCDEGHTYSDDRDPDCDICGEIRDLPSEFVVGDLDGNNAVSDADAVYLLMHTFFADFYPVNQDCDFNKDSVVSDADATYLLMHTFFPEFYPIG